MKCNGSGGRQYENVSLRAGGGGRAYLATGASLWNVPSLNHSMNTPRLQFQYKANSSRDRAMRYLATIVLAATVRDAFRPSVPITVSKLKFIGKM
jgi:hypothetical protein